MKTRIIFIGAGVVAALVVLRLVLAGSSVSTPGDVAVDTTGASAQSTATSRQAVAAAPTAEPTPASEQPTPSAAATDSAAAEPIAAPQVQVSGTAVSVERKPLLLLNPTTVRQGSSIGVTASGFDAGATVDLVLKRNAGDDSNQLTSMEVDKSGGFGGLNFPVPDSLPRGNFVVEARQQNSNKVAHATAVVAGIRSSPVCRWTSHPPVHK
jgi:hypothetical protein